MTTLNKLLDKARELRSIPSDMALSEKLGVSRSAVSLWRKGGVIGEKHLTALITLADADPASAIEVMAEQATTKQERAVWGSLQQRLGIAAMHIMSTVRQWNAARRPTLAYS